MDKKTLILVTVLLLFLAAFLAHNYIFSIYETKILVDKPELYADGSSELVIAAVPINSLGFKPPFRQSYTKFAVEEGKELIDIVSLDETGGTIKIKAKFATGKVVIKVTPKYAMFPTKVEIAIMKNLV